MLNPYRVFYETREEDANAARELVAKTRNFLLYHSFLGNDHTIQTYDHMEQGLAARANSYQRQSESFGVDNSFSTDSPGTRSFFNDEIKEKMRELVEPRTPSASDQDIDSRGGWEELIHCAEIYAEEVLYLQHHSDSPINVSEAIQFMTLKLSFRCFIDLDIAIKEWHQRVEQFYSDFLFIAREMNRLTNAATTAPPATPLNWKDQTALHAALRTVIGPDTDYDPLAPFINPMNYLIPAYEHVWTVVLRGVIEVLTPSENSPKWQESLQSFVGPEEDGERIWDTDDDEEHKIPPADIIKEILRLHPPIRHVRRQVTAGDSEVFTDITKCHRSELLAPGDPLEFRPERWRQLRQAYCHGDTAQDIKTKERQLGFMPFGLTCPSDSLEASDFGMKLIAVLVGVFCGLLQDTWNLEPLSSLPRPLDSDRNAFQDLMLDDEDDEDHFGGAIDQLSDRMETAL
ncbi:hypothetical protein BT63DRAFT_469225 [Microthyrium microscopicum]|uniref:Cytochrome P450 n=1 Tax=Microthyrium microscopicum TaxID=703497 RepID=A0A6A6UK23_9PEZI|nr:hypothetical protein BT63DRAFT_469225 [Microthyrium microscopicum]